MKRNMSLSVAILWATSGCAPATHGFYKASQTISVTGCVQNHGAMSSATMDGGYLLTNTFTGNAAGLRTSSPGTVGPPEPSATTPASSGTASGTQSVFTADSDVERAHRSASYMLDGRDSELRTLIDHRAEIIGTLEAHIDEPGDSNSIPTRGSKTTHGRDTGLRWLRVLSVKVISSECSARKSET